MFGHCNDINIFSLMAIPSILIDKSLVFIVSERDYIYMIRSINGSFMWHLQYYLEKNLDAREKAIEREAEIEDRSPKAKAKSKMSKVTKN